MNGFLNAPGLPFSNILTAERIREVFARHGGLFGEHGIYSTVIVLWAFLSQVLRDGKEAACQSAVAQITAHCIQTGIDPPSKDTGDYCRGREKLSDAALHELTCVVAEDLEQQANEEWLWENRHAKLVDGFTFTMPATDENLAEFPHPKTQKTLELRELRYTVVEKGRRTENITVVTTLTDHIVYSHEEIATLYGFRWNSELDIRSIKSNLNLGHVRCKSPHMVRREFWTTLLAYNLIRITAANAAALHDKPPRQISFTSTCQFVLASWQRLSDSSLTCDELLNQCRILLRQISTCIVANRPGRLEPRVLRRRRHGYPLMQKPRNLLRNELRKDCT